MKIITVDDMYKNVEIYSSEYILCISNNFETINLNTKFYLLNSDEYDEEEQKQVFAVQYFLDMGDVEGIKENMLQQGAKYGTLDNFIKALNYYYAHDAFYNFEDESSNAPSSEASA